MVRDKNVVVQHRSMGKKIRRVGGDEINSDFGMLGGGGGGAKAGVENSEGVIVKEVGHNIRHVCVFVCDGGPLAVGCIEVTQDNGVFVFVQEPRDVVGKLKPTFNASASLTVDDANKGRGVGTREMGGDPESMWGVKVGGRKEWFVGDMVSNIDGKATFAVNSVREVSSVAVEIRGRRVSGALSLRDGKDNRSMLIQEEGNEGNLSIIERVSVPSHKVHLGWVAVFRRPLEKLFEFGWSRWPSLRLGRRRLES